MVVGTPTERPAKLAIRLADGHVVARCEAVLHETVWIELPVLVAIRAIPLVGIVMPLVGEAYRDSIAAECPQLLDQPIVQFAPPFAGEEGDDLFATGRKLGAIAPFAVDRVRQRDTLGITAVPCVLGKSSLDSRGFDRERRQGWTLLAHC